jgi:uncharacterized membrane-anchored protein YjiN (DUF445 family)
MAMNLNPAGSEVSSYIKKCKAMCLHLPLLSLLIMSHSLNEKQSQLLQECLSMAQELKCHADADRRFLDLEETLSDDAATVAVLEALWKEVLAARRSATYWQQISDVERSLTDNLASNHVQLQQNYLRLLQEQ